MRVSAVIRLLLAYFASLYEEGLFFGQYTTLGIVRVTVGVPVDTWSLDTSYKCY